MAISHGDFVWYELMTTDTQAAAAFYRSVIGWTTQDSGMPGMDYTILSTGPGAGMAGLMAVPPEAAAMGAKPGWVGYIAVDDVDACSARLAGVGGAVLKPAMDIPGVGRMGVVADPQGAVFMLFKAAPSETQMPAVPRGTPGHVGWCELYAVDQASAFAFYAGLFGWTQGEAMDMGPMGIYQLFTTPNGSGGGMMNKMADMPVPAWGYYFNVDDINTAIARVNSHAGKVLMGPHQVPGGEWIAQCIDPQGAVFAMVAPAS